MSKTGDTDIPDHWLVLLRQFRREVDNHGALVDPGNEEDWKSLTLGWAIGKGLPPEESREFAVYVRYKTDMG